MRWVVFPARRSFWFYPRPAVPAGRRPRSHHSRGRPPGAGPAWACGLRSAARRALVPRLFPASAARCGPRLAPLISYLPASGGACAWSYTAWLRGRARPVGPPEPLEHAGHWSYSLPARFASGGRGSAGPRWRLCLRAARLGVSRVRSRFSCPVRLSGSPAGAPVPFPPPPGLGRASAPSGSPGGRAGRRCPGAVPAGFGLPALWPGPGRAACPAVSSVALWVLRWAGACAGPGPGASGACAASGAPGPPVAAAGVRPRSACLGRGAVPGLQLASGAAAPFFWLHTTPTRPRRKTSRKGRVAHPTAQKQRRVGPGARLPDFRSPLRPPRGTREYPSGKGGKATKPAPLAASPVTVVYSTV